MILVAVKADVIQLRRKRPCARFPSRTVQRLVSVSAPTAAAALEVDGSPGNRNEKASSVLSTL